jgi:two-component system phosphate regulon sensor histidine kinase PhoR
MRKRRLLWQLYPSYLLVTLLSLFAVAWYASESVREPYIDQVTADLEARARLTEGQVAPSVQREEWRRIDRLCKDLGARTATRITVVLPSGRVVGDSLEDPARMENHADRPEIIRALADQVGRSTRYSYTIHRRLRYVAVPVKAGGEMIGVIRCSVPITSIDRALRAIYARIAVGGIIVAALAAFLALMLARRLSSPLEEMKQGAERFAEGDFSRRLPDSNTAEVSALAEAMNRMAEQLDDRIRDIERRRNESEAVLSSMEEGVIAVDSEERLLGVNRAAARLLGIDSGRAQGRSIQEVVRNTALLAIAADALAGREPKQGDVTVHGDRTIAMSVRATPLRDAAGRTLGALIVLADVTELRRLERIRREFVANVSHELKTPITSIKGFVETLLEGALEDADKARHFLDVIGRQADRLQAIIEDLLALSRIEQESEERQIAIAEGAIHDVLESALGARAEQADAKGLHLRLACAPDLRAPINAPLLEQAVVNLIDNAVRYSNPGGEVEVQAEQIGNEVIIAVHDHGCGIAEEHLPRLFERFYRVDKGRDRALGGTGLGLAIVKHIALAHGGRVAVESVPGEGSTFRIHLPSPA